eukprot:6017285-Pleurochrysis_carterae.AAC.1
MRGNVSHACRGAVRTVCAPGRQGGYMEGTRRMSFQAKREIGARNRNLREHSAYLGDGAADEVNREAHERGRREEADRPHGKAKPGM